MIGSKTRIRRGGLSEIMGGEQEATADSQRATSPEPADESAPTSAPAALSFRLPARQTPIVPALKTRLGSGTLVGHVFDLSSLDGGQPSERSVRRSSPLATTRLIPIEELFVDGVVPTPTSPAHAERTLPSNKQARDEEEELARVVPKLRLSGTHLRRGLMVVLALATVCVFANRRRGATAVPALPASTVTQPAVTAASTTTADIAEASTAIISGPATVSATVPSARQRAAVDALVAGDFVSARRLYIELAEAAGPSSSKVFAEAARILDQQIHGKN